VLVEERRSKKTGSAPTPPTVLTVRELSEYLRVHPTTVYRLLRAKQLPGFRVGSEWRFSLDVIDRWRSEGEQASVSARPRRKRAG
jgi:excisionase family DNA binding protein